MANEILTRAIDALASGTDLSAEQSAEVLAQIMRGEVSEVQIAGFLIALRAKGETVKRLNDGRVDRGRAGLRRGQARQSLGNQLIGLRRRARGARRAHRSRPRGGCELHRARRLRLHVRSRPPSGDALRGARAPR